ncbi:hypothetical protein, partial [Companilactobacillus metriopterae]|uniref:hypothetical protein n=1 Tax=Companilactobacillus metriopterae TaxID=1909267 RepID=UPI0013E96D6B
MLPFVIALGLSILLGIATQILTTLGLIALDILRRLFNRLVKLGLLALFGLLFAFVGIPLVLIGQVIGFFLLLALNAFIGFVLWLLSSIAKDLGLLAIAAGLFLLPLAGQLVFALVTKWTIRAIIHIIRFFVGAFRLGARLVLSFIIGLANVLTGLLRLANFIAGLVNAALSVLSLLLPVPGWLLFPLFALLTLLNIANELFLLPLKLFLDLLSLLDIGTLLFVSLPYFLFIRPLISFLMALTAGLVSDVILFLIGLPLFLLGQLLLQGLITLP